MTCGRFQTRMKLIGTWIRCRLNRSPHHRTLKQSLNRTLWSSAVLWAHCSPHRPTLMQHRRHPPHQTGPLHRLGLDPDLDHASQTSSEHLNMGRLRRTHPDLARLSQHYCKPQLQQCHGPCLSQQLRLVRLLVGRSPEVERQYSRRSRGASACSRALFRVMRSQAELKRL